LGIFKMMFDKFPETLMMQQVAVELKVASMLKTLREQSSMRRSSRRPSFLHFTWSSVNLWSNRLSSSTLESADTEAPPVESSWAGAPTTVLPGRNTLLTLQASIEQTSHLTCADASWPRQQEEDDNHSHHSHTSEAAVLDSELSEPDSNECSDAAHEPKVLLEESICLRLPGHPSTRSSSGSSLVHLPVVTVPELSVGCTASHACKEFAQGTASSSSKPLQSEAARDNTDGGAGVWRLQESDKADLRV